MKHNNDTLSTRSQFGFSLVELLIYMAILMVLMMLVSFSFTQTLQRSAQQSGIAETEIETGVGLEFLRSDLEHAGFGLPWSFPAPPAPYTEPGPMSDMPDVPRALNGEDNSGSSLNEADYLVIRGTNVTRDMSSQKWGRLGRDIDHNIVVESSSDEADKKLTNNDWVIALHSANTAASFRSLVMDGTAYAFQADPTDMESVAPSDTPQDPDGEKLLLYGIDGGGISRPFNRTDYHIRDSDIPAHCAPHTGVLTKATLNQVDDDFTFLPVVDCVADFQVVYYMDTNDDGGWEDRMSASELNGLSAEQIRNQVKEIRCYILLHEGGEDRAYVHPNNDINVGEMTADGTTLLAGRTFKLSEVIGPTWANYRWKVVGLTVAPKNLK